MSRFINSFKFAVGFDKSSPPKSESTTPKHGDRNAERSSRFFSIRKSRSSETSGSDMPGLVSAHRDEAAHLPSERPAHDRKSLVPLIGSGSPVQQKEALRVVRLSEFKVRSRIGEGSFAIVCSATWKSTGKRVAVKVVKPEEQLQLSNGDDSYGEVSYADVLRTFRDEIKVMEHLGEHPNIVQALGKVDNGTAYVMERASGDLFSIIHKVKRGLPLSLVKHWAKQILTGVDYIHSMGYVHQDIKSGNILIQEDRTAKICDFGLARKGAGDMKVDRELLTLWYRAPELLMGSPVYTPKVDLWGVGCILLEVIIGHAPFPGNPSCGCNCNRASHVNYNSDQLSRIFKVCGSPHREDMEGMKCADHFAHWPKYDNCLTEIVTESCLDSPVRKQEAAVKSESALEEQGKQWSELIHCLLALNHRHRGDAKAALDCDLFITGRRSTSIRTTNKGSPKGSPKGFPEVGSPKKSSMYSEDLMEYRNFSAPDVGAELNIGI